MRRWVNIRIGLALLLAGATAPIMPAWAQEDLSPVADPSLTATASSLADLTPPDWKIERQASGDVDGDGVPDIVAVMKGTDPTFVSKRFASSHENLDANPRVLVVLLGERSGVYRLAVEDRSVVPRHDSATIEDPFGEDGGLEIAGGAFSVTLHRFSTAGGTDMGNTTLMFRMFGSRCVLIGFDRFRVERFSGETRTPSLAEESMTAQNHPYVGMWVTEDGRIRHALLPDGRYDEARGNRKSAYQGRYEVTGTHIEYWDDAGFTADGNFVDIDTLHHARMVLRRQR